LGSLDNKKLVGEKIERYQKEFGGRGTQHRIGSPKLIIPLGRIPVNDQYLERKKGERGGKRRGHMGKWASKVIEKGGTHAQYCKQGIPATRRIKHMAGAET